MRAILLVGLLSLPLRAEAAWPTKVLSAVEKEKSIPDIHVELTYDRLSKNARITREWVQDDAMGNPAALDVRELDYEEITQRMLVALRVGLYRDLELHVIAPIVFQNDSKIGFAEGVENRSTVYGSVNADDPAYDYRFPVTTVPAERERAGFGDMTFGLSFSPVVEKKDEAWPTLTLRADIIAPTGTRRDPADVNALPGGKSGRIGSGMTIFDFTIGVSKRISSGTPTLDPYMLFNASIPVANSSQKAIGMDPPVEGSFKVGSELILWEHAETKQFYSLDFAFGFRYTAIGRTFSELSDYLPNFNQMGPRSLDMGRENQPRDTFIYEDYQDPANYNNQDSAASCGAVSGTSCGELTRVDEHLAMDGTVVVHIQPLEYVVIRAGVSLGIVTDHLITAESVGRDTDPDGNETCGTEPCAGRVNAINSNGEDERSKYYDPRYDQPGRRFRAEDTTNFTFFVTGAATF
jgi:hypothetical protein